MNIRLLPTRKLPPRLGSMALGSHLHQFITSTTAGHTIILRLQIMRAQYESMGNAGAHIEKIWSTWEWR